MTPTLTPVRPLPRLCQGEVSSHLLRSLRLACGPSQSTDLNLNSHAPRPLPLQVPDPGVPEGASATSETPTRVPKACGFLRSVAQVLALQDPAWSLRGQAHSPGCGLRCAVTLHTPRL